MGRLLDTVLVSRVVFGWLGICAIGKRMSVEYRCPLPVCTASARGLLLLSPLHRYGRTGYMGPSREGMQG